MFRCFFFFFQAEDGIRDGRVTGVQTCALPIYVLPDVHRLADMLPEELAVLEQAFGIVAAGSVVEPNAAEHRVPSATKRTPAPRMKRRARLPSRGRRQKRQRAGSTG